MKTNIKTMKDITVIIPVHKLNTKDEQFLKKAIYSYLSNVKTYTHGDLFLIIISSKEAYKNVTKLAESALNNEISNYSIIINNGETDYCSQINTAVKSVKTDLFSILEMDDEYSSKWFEMMYPWYQSNNSVSVFLPLNVQYNEEHTKWQYGNELVWANSFSNELGVIDFDCLENCSTFNLTGGVFNTEDFVNIGGLKPSIKVAFNYEFLLRLTNKKLKAIVVPKEGYKHLIGRENSLTETYEKTIEADSIQKWFELAKCEYPFIEDRKRTIVMETKQEILK